MWLSASPPTRSRILTLVVSMTSLTTRAATSSFGVVALLFSKRTTRMAAMGLSCGRRAAGHRCIPRGRFGVEIPCYPWHFRQAIEIEGQDGGDVGSRANPLYVYILSPI